MTETVRYGLDGESHPKYIIPAPVPEPEVAPEGFNGAYSQPPARGDEIDDTPPLDVVENRGGANVVLGGLYKSETGDVHLKNGSNETIHLIPEDRRTANLVGANKYGELTARPANSSERGGGLPVVLSSDITTDTLQENDPGSDGKPPKSHKRSSFTMQ